MENYTKEELTEALRAVNSIIQKCEKAQEKFPEGNCHHTLLRNRLKAMYISKSLITESLSNKDQTPTLPVALNTVPNQQMNSGQIDKPESEMNCSDDAELLILNLDRLHTTDLGIERMKRNLCLDVGDTVDWCRQKIKDPLSSIRRKGKNWYITAGDCVITVNAYSYTIITAHKLTNGQAKSPVL